MRLRGTHRIAILWKNGRITRHRTTGLIVRSDRITGAIIGLESEHLTPQLVGIDVGQVAAVIRGRVR